MLLYRGDSPYSSFRQEKLLAKIQAVAPEITAVMVHQVFFVQAGNLSSDEIAAIKRILNSRCELWTPPESDWIWVTPRFGTISPWSSKASDILHVCGYEKVERVERGIIYQLLTSQEVYQGDLTAIIPLLHDRMTETYSLQYQALNSLFASQTGPSSEALALKDRGEDVLREANCTLGLALSEEDIQYLYQHYTRLNRDPMPVELMMFAQINSEHCRHKIFNAEWWEDGSKKSSLFSMIRHTYQQSPQGVITAYKDNGAVMSGPLTDYFFSSPVDQIYRFEHEPIHIVIKVETHNHPTAIAPFEGAATGAGGEIRDEGATGIGGKPKAGLTGFSVSHLHIPALPQPWERKSHYPRTIATALDIMLQGPIGAASFNNEFGRPGLCGYFRTYEQLESQQSDKIQLRGYHKPIMIAGGLGQIRQTATEKHTLPIGAKLIILGGPAMLIGLGGGAASSLSLSNDREALDFASVQRSNPEMERRAQEVINACTALGKKNPIISIHDVGAGGLSNALPELIHDSKRGAWIDLRAIPTADPSLNALEIWCNEAQERYVLSIRAEDVTQFTDIANRERCPFAIVGDIDNTEQLQVIDPIYQQMPVDIPLPVLFGEAAKVQREMTPPTNQTYQPLKLDFSIAELIQRVLSLPAVADKRFLITIGDRSVSGLVARDQMVGPWQVAVADVAVTASGYSAYTGEAMAMGERTPISLLDAPASARMAVAEAITNIAAADIQAISDIKLSANWMAAVNYRNEDRQLYAAVEAVAMTLCPALGICIPVGKDSMSMQLEWQEGDTSVSVTAPLSLIISAFAPVTDIRRTLTPLLTTEDETELLLIDLGAGKNRLGASALAQVTDQLGDIPPDLDDPVRLKNFFRAMQALRTANLITAYHDRSDGGLLALICEMSFASHVGVTIQLDELDVNYLASLFSEELGAVIQYPKRNQEKVRSILTAANLGSFCHRIGHLNDQDTIVFKYDQKIIYETKRTTLHQLWSQTSYHLQALRDNPLCAEQEFEDLGDLANPGLHAKLTFAIPETPAIIGTRPRVAILREQGVNGHMEMAAAFDRAGFTAVDVHMTDILTERVKLTSFQGMVACGGFSYGDVLGAGKGWANSILYHEIAREQFVNFFNLSNVFVLGICNGCQMLSNLKELIPGAATWPHFTRNHSEQFEARLSLVKVRSSRSLFFEGMADSVLPIVVSHGEGQVQFANDQDCQIALEQGLVPLQYVDHYDQVTERYPANPNGSHLGITALTNEDGRVAIMMPHPERVFRTVQFSWHPTSWPENSPWFKLFLNARRYCE